MGIHNFHKWVKQNHSECIKPILTSIEVDHLYIDVNFCLHNVAYNTKNRSVLMKKVCTFINNMLNIIKPTKTLTLASDGPAPYAKLILQRIRRLNISRNLDNEIDADEINPICFTPGTKFMTEFNFTMKDFIEKIKKKYNVQVFELLKGPNEAELKIINQLLLNNNNNPNDHHIILSNDADVCVMTTVLKCYDKISIAVKLKKNIDLFEIKNFANIIDFPINNYQKNVDLSFILLFMGNDYLPKLLYISFDSLLKSYKMALRINKKGLINENMTINIKFLKDLMMILSLNFKNIGWINCFSIIDFDIKLYKNYIEGLLWCVDCYKNGMCLKYDYMYEHKKSPHPLGIFYYLAFNNKIEKPIPNPEPIPDYIYALLVIPKKAKNLIDPKYHSIMDNKLKFLYEEENCKECVQMHSKLSDLDKTIKYMITINENFDKLREESTNLSKKLTKHKAIHKSISFNDIKFVINLLKNNN